MRISEANRKWWTLAGACAGLFLLMLDSTVVALALPAIRHDVDASSEGLQWVMNGYLLTIAVLVVTAGRLGDMFGRKRVFLAGMVLFAAGSVVSGAATDQDLLILGRVLQGAGAAPMLSLSLALVCNVFPSEEQPRALGIWAAVSAVALAIGPLAGGLLIEIDWRVIFWMNLPISALGIAITIAAAPESTDPGAGDRIDWPGLAFLSVGLTAVILALVQSRAWGAGTTATLAILGVLALLAFWAIEHRARAPIVEFDLFRNGPYFGASAAAFALVGSYWAVMFFQPQYLQDVRGHSPILSGLMILPVTVPMIFISPYSGRLIARLGARRLMTAGMLCGLIGLLVLTRIEADSPYGCCSPATYCSGSPLASSTRRCRPRRWRRCPETRSASPPASWRWTASSPVPSPSPPPAPPSTPCSATVIPSPPPSWARPGSSSSFAPSAPP
jgi:EmrB/QacA subfamily drug resistance transporter